jgi:type IX secretion system PorP/SprF family membrane protein
MNVPKLQMHKQAPMKRNEVLVNRGCGNIGQEALPGMSIKRLLGAIALLLGLYSSAQDLHFSQFFEAPLLRNPSLAGIFAGDFRAQMVYRNQWASVTTPYQTASLNSEYKFPVGRGNDFMTAGLQILWDKAGTIALSTTHLLPAINYHKSLSDEHNSYLSLGFMGGLVQRTLDRSKLTTNNQFDGFAYNGSLPDGENFVNNYTFFDASVGMSYNASFGPKEENNYFLGVAYHHFNKPINSFYQTLNHIPKWVVSGGLKLNVSDLSYMTIQGDYSRQGPFREIIAGAMYSYKLDDDEKPQYVIHGGAYLRWDDAFIPVVKLDYLPFSIAFSYDVNVSQLRTGSQGRGGFEFSVTYITFFDRDNSTRDKVRCPKF